MAYYFPCMSKTGVSIVGDESISVTRTRAWTDWDHIDTVRRGSISQFHHDTFRTCLSIKHQPGSLATRRHPLYFILCQFCRYWPCGHCSLSFFSAVDGSFQGTAKNLRGRTRVMSTHHPRPVRGEKKIAKTLQNQSLCNLRRTTGGTGNMTKRMGKSGYNPPVSHAQQRYHQCNAYKSPCFQVAARP